MARSVTMVSEAQRWVRQQVADDLPVKLSFCSNEFELVESAIVPNTRGIFNGNAGIPDNHVCGYEFAADRKSNKVPLRRIAVRMLSGYERWSLIEYLKTIQVRQI